MIIAGEASGDHHGASLVKAVKSLKSDIDYFGIGGEQMRAAGVKCHVDAAEMAVVGIVEVLAHFRFIYGVLQKMRGLLKSDPPDLLILVDYPEFNLRLAKTAKELGIKVLFYISPQIWAWRQKRVYKIKRLVDMMAVVFPFELPFYQQAGVPVRFVGHPLIDDVNSDLDRESARSYFGLNAKRPVVGLFPGSRRSEIRRLLPTMLESAKQLVQQRPDLQFILPRASTLNEADFAPYLLNHDLPITITNGESYRVMQSCDAIISASGTATLEIALMQCPLVVIYKIAPLSYQLMSRMIKIDHIALCNIVAGERIAPELIQHDATAEKISAEILPLINDAEKNQQIRQQLAQVRVNLGEGGASDRIATLTLEMLNVD